MDMDVVFLIVGGVDTGAVLTDVGSGVSEALCGEHMASRKGGVRRGFFPGKKDVTVASVEIGLPLQEIGVTSTRGPRAATILLWHTAVSSSQSELSDDTCPESLSLSSLTDIFCLFGFEGER